LNVEIILLLMVIVTAWHMWSRRRLPASRVHGAIDAIVPAYNEELCLEASLRKLLLSPYIGRVICVNDGSKDGTKDVLERMSHEWGEKLLAINQENTGKGGALMNGIRSSKAQYVFLTDADTDVPPESMALGYLLAEIENGADAVGGIPSTSLEGAGLLPYIRASVKVPMIIMQRTFQQVLGGSPFLISGACGLFRREVLLKHPFSDRTKVEDLDLTWTLVANGYKVRQAYRCMVYSQEGNSLKEEWKRWRRWIVGYAVCMRLHRNLLLSRFGIFSMIPMVVTVFVGVVAYSLAWSRLIAVFGLPKGLLLAMFPLSWTLIVSLIGGISAWHHRKLVFVPLASLAILYVFFAYAIWIVHGLKGLVTGREPARDKPTRYANVVE